MMGKDNIPVIEPYNPLDKRNLGASVAATMLAAPIHSLPPEPFIGAGVCDILPRGFCAISTIGRVKSGRL